MWFFSPYTTNPVIRPLMIRRTWSFGGRRFPRICEIATAIVGSPLDGPSS